MKRRIAEKIVKRADALGRATAPDAAWDHPHACDPAGYQSAYNRWQLTKADSVIARSNRRVCTREGHDLETESSIGPDSGVEYFTCNRCDYFHRVVWY